MDYPLNFPARLQPRVDAEIVRLRMKFPLAGDALKRIKETVAFFADIACRAVEEGEWRVDLAYSGLKHFTLKLCVDHTDNTQDEWWTDKARNEYLDELMQRLTGSIEWLGYLDRLAKLAE